jgi:hypothetical protein
MNSKPLKVESSSAYRLLRQLKLDLMGPKSRVPVAKRRIASRGYARISFPALHEIGRNDVSLSFTTTANRLPNALLSRCASQEDWNFRNFHLRIVNLI